MTSQTTETLAHITGAMMIIPVNNTCVPGNSTTTGTCNEPRSSAGLASGLTIFFLLLVIATCLIVYKYHSKIRNMFQSGQRTSVKKEEYTVTPQAEQHPYTSVSRDSMAGQPPIYENLMTRNNKQAPKQSRSSREPDEDLYLQCDLPDDVIYHNDPACNLSLLPGTPEEDVYIVPDA